jgi:hypothetical protein
MEFIILLIIAGVAFYYFRTKKPLGDNPAEYKPDAYDSLKWGSLNEQLICPHCQNKGFTHTKHVDRKKGVSGGKATAALLTLGFSMLATGLSRKEGCTQAHCIKCNSTWDY